MYVLQERFRDKICDQSKGEDDDEDSPCKSEPTLSLPSKLEEQSSTEESSVLLVRWLREKIVTDWKKAPNLSHKLSTIWKTNLVWLPLDPIIRGGVTGNSFCDNLC